MLLVRESSVFGDQGNLSVRLPGTRMGQALGPLAGVTLWYRSQDNIPPNMRGPQNSHCI
ncbi:hypothetical protein PAXINDRAFT_170556 [Paxillus involutus ATCC 200175]|uniref:Uncharacterized protein n=1 Tax=Paxillus involutus ATCC 200175 TaxID=664439 RepID=A0A0C9TCI1_PAXIN|nr:hypothetical protein PAXINDRAFT_170556 [Paxillus involutus ATCC 200175]